MKRPSIFLASAALALAGAATVANAAVDYAPVIEDDNVCMITFNDPAHAQKSDVRAIAMAQILPRVTAVSLHNAVNRIFYYPTQDAAVQACQCLASPWPAGTMAERYQSALACAKPERVE